MASPVDSSQTVVYPRSHLKRWTSSEEEMMIEKVKGGATHSETADSLGRSENAVVFRLIHCLRRDNGGVISDSLMESHKLTKEHIDEFDTRRKDQEELNKEIKKTRSLARQVKLGEITEAQAEEQGAYMPGLLKRLNQLKEPGLFKYEIKRMTKAIKRMENRTEAEAERILKDSLWVLPHQREGFLELMKTVPFDLPKSPVVRKNKRKTKSQEPEDLPATVRQRKLKVQKLEKELELTKNKLKKLLVDCIRTEISDHVLVSTVREIAEVLKLDVDL